MRSRITIACIAVIILSCSSQPSNNNASNANRSIVGTWKLLKGTLIGKGDTTVTDYTRNTSFIKIINATHFAFLQHGLDKAKDSSFSAGGGHYTLKDSSYTEHLEYCNAREWEGHDFTFTVSFNGDTLIQKGMETVPGTNINRMNIEQYVRLKD